MESYAGRSESTGALLATDGIGGHPWSDCAHRAPWLRPFPNWRMIFDVRPALTIRPSAGEIETPSLPTPFRWVACLPPPHNQSGLLQLFLRFATGRPDDGRYLHFSGMDCCRSPAQSCPADSSPVWQSPASGNWTAGGGRSGCSCPMSDGVRLRRVSSPCRYFLATKRIFADCYAGRCERIDAIRLPAPRSKSSCGRRSTPRGRISVPIIDRPAIPRIFYRCSTASRPVYPDQHHRFCAACSAKSNVITRHIVNRIFMETSCTLRRFSAPSSASPPPQPTRPASSLRERSSSFGGCGLIRPPSMSAGSDAASPSRFIG